MKRELSHDEVFAVLDAAALDVLATEEREAVLWHAATCAKCNAELTALRDTAAMIAFSSPMAADTPSKTRARVRDRLMSRAAGDEPAPVAPRPPAYAAGHGESVPSLVPHVLFPTTRPEMAAQERRYAWVRPEWIAIAATVVAVASLAGLAITMRDRDNVQAALKEANTATAQVRTVADSLRTALVSRDSVIAGMTGKNVDMMTLVANETRTPMGHIYWDQANNTWTLVAHDLPAPAPGRTYQLWLVTRRAKISAGMFAVNGSGDAMMRTTYPLPASELRAVMVTDEPAGGMPQPTGATVMAAQAH